MGQIFADSSKPPENQMTGPEYILGKLPTILAILDHASSVMYYKILP
jgi:hypothetical protein